MFFSFHIVRLCLSSFCSFLNLDGVLDDMFVRPGCLLNHFLVNEDATTFIFHHLVRNVTGNTTPCALKQTLCLLVVFVHFDGVLVALGFVFGATVRDPKDQAVPIC